MTTLRRSPSGPDVLIADTTVPPFTHNAYVDNGTSVPIANQNGSVAAPYVACQQAVDAALAAGYTGVQIFFVFGSDVIILPPNFALAVQGSIGTSSFLQIVANNNTIITVTDLNVQSITTANPADNVVFVYRLSAPSEAFGTADILSTCVLPSGNASLYNIGIYGPITAIQVYLEGCSWGGAYIGGISSIAALRTFNVDFNGIFEIDTSNAVLRSSEFRNPVNIVCGMPIELDSYTNARFVASGSTAGGGTTVIG